MKYKNKTIIHIKATQSKHEQKQREQTEKKTKQRKKKCNHFHLTRFLYVFFFLLYVPKCTRDADKNLRRFKTITNFRLGNSFFFSYFFALLVFVFAAAIVSDVGIFISSHFFLYIQHIILFPICDIWSRMKKSEGKSV